MKLVRLCMLALALAGSAFAQDVLPLPEAPAEETVLPGFAPPVERRFAELIWNEAAGRLDRRSYVFFDPLDGGPWDLFWEARSSEKDASGPITGEGRMVWRRRGSGFDDPDGIVATYDGALSGGRLEGAGVFRHISGASYAGDWTGGRMDGSGRLQLPSGDEYAGTFVNGRRSGAGTYVDRFGNVYDGEFRAGRREGAGTVYPVAAPAFHARWRGGLEEPGSRRPLPQGEGSAHIRPSQYQVWPDAQVSAGVVMGAKGFTNLSNELQYTSYADGETLVAYPGDPEIMNSWNGVQDIAIEPLKPTGYIGIDTRFLPVGFQFGLENRSSGPLRVVGAFLDVTGSQSELRPILTLSSSSQSQQCVGDPSRTAAKCPPGHVERTLFITNFGWSAAQNARVDFSFTDRMGNAVFRAPTIAVGTIARRKDVDIAPVLAAMGMNLDSASQTMFHCQGQADCLAQASRSGAFGQLAPLLTADSNSFDVSISGSVTYDWTEANGAVLSRTVPFKTAITLGAIYNAAEFGEMSDAVPLRPAAFKLPYDRGAYRMPLPLSADVPAGRIMNWSVAVESDRTTTTEFRFVLQLSDGREIASRPVRLLYFVPNLWPGG